MAEEKKNELLEFVGLYVGKEARRKRVLKSGKDAGKEITIFGLNIKEREDSLFAKSFTAQSNTKGFDTIKELDWVRVGYMLDKYISKAGNNVTSHKVMWIGKTDSPNQQSNQKPTSIKPDLSKFEEFKGKYLTMLKNANMQPNPVHMVGSFIATYEKDRVKELIEKCKEALKQ